MIPDISVVLPTYNRERYLRESVQSILDQSFSDFELIIINDGSTDNSEKIIKEFHDPRIKYYFSKKNRGPAGAFNHGIQMSQGAIIAFQSSDDISLPERLQKQFKALQDSDAHIAWSFVSFIDKEGFPIQYDYKSPHINVYCEHKDDFLPRMFQNNYVNSCSVMVRKEVFLKTELFDETIEYGDDWELWLRILKQFNFKIVPEPLVKYRIHSFNESVDLSKKRFFFYAYALMKGVLNFTIEDIFPKLKESSFSEEERKQRYAQAYLALAKNLYLSGHMEILPLAKVYFSKAMALDSTIEKLDNLDFMAQRYAAIWSRYHFLTHRLELEKKILNDWRCCLKHFIGLLWKRLNILSWIKSFF